MLRHSPICGSRLSRRGLCEVCAAPLPHALGVDAPVDPDTQIPFPVHLPLTTPLSPSLSLVGLGVRKVSFLRVKVYSVGFYLEDSLTDRLAGLPGWKVSPPVTTQESS
jgi:hypothetical protein